MKITSPAFTENTKIPKVYSKLDDNQHPPLAINDTSADAKSLAIVCHDPGAPGRDGFYHWTVWNVPAETTEITRWHCRGDDQLGLSWLGRAAVAVWHAPLSILRVCVGCDTRFTKRHQTQRTHRHPHTAHHRPRRVDWEVWHACPLYFTSQRASSPSSDTKA